MRNTKSYVCIPIIIIYNKHYKYYMKYVGGSGSPLKKEDQFCIIEEVRISEIIPYSCIQLSCKRETSNVCEQKKSYYPCGVMSMCYFFLWLFFLSHNQYIQYSTRLIEQKSLRGFTHPFKSTIDTMCCKIICMNIIY